MYIVWQFFKNYTLIKNKIILGTVQLGVDYGINNKKGRPKRSHSLEILKYAHNNGIKTVDTSDSYGTSNELISDYNKTSLKPYRVIYKLNFEHPNSKLDLRKQIIRKIKNLNLDQLYCFMFHSYENFSLFYENTYESLENLKKENILKKIGVSVYNNQQAISVLNNYNIDVIQIPFNILDNFNKRGEIIDLAQRKGVEIHARSIFLQGLFFVELNKLHPKLEPLKKYLIKIHDIANQYEISINNLAINYAYTQKRIKNILIGVDSINQLKQNIHNINDEFDEKIIDEVNTIDIQEIELLDPLFWIKEKIINLHKTS